MVLLAGGAYILYPSNPTVREQLRGLLKRVKPGAEGNAAKDAVSKVAPSGTAQRTVYTVGSQLQ